MSFIDGLRIELYEGYNFDTLRTISQETTVNISDQHDLDQGGDGNTFSIRATGQIQAYAEGSNTWKVRSDDGVKIWIDDVLVVNRWNDHRPTWDTFTVSGLNKDSWHDIKIEHYEKTGVAVLDLYHSDQSTLVTQLRTAIPTVQSVSSSTADGTYKAGDTITINVVFSEAVTVNTTGGTPQLTLETGTADRAVNYSSGSGTNTLAFSYTVQAGDTASDLNYKATSSLALNGGTIKDAAGNSATLTLPAVDGSDSLAGNSALVIDTTGPTFSSAATSTDGTKVVLTYNEALSATTAAASAFTVTSGGIGNDVTAVAVSGSTVELTVSRPIPSWHALTVAYADPSSSNDTNAVQDSQGNDAASLSSTSVTNNSTVEGRAFEEAGNQSTLKSSTTDDWYGTAVTLSKDGSTMAVGVPRAAGGGTRRGQVRIYKRSGDDWNLIDTINGTQDLAQQGHAISLSADGNIIAIGAAAYDNGSKSNAGHIRTFKYDTSSSSYSGYGSNHEIKGRNISDSFGVSVSLSADGKVLAAGASGHDYSNQSDVGYIEIYHLNDSNQWVRKLFKRGSLEDNHFGGEIAVSADGKTVAVGGPGDTSNSNQGRVVVYRYNESSDNWLILGRGKWGEASEDRFGRSLSISADGSVLAVGGPENDDAGSNRGRVDLFELSESGDLQPIGLPIYGEANDDQSGVAVSLSDNGKRVAIAAHLNDGGGTDSGHVRLYEFIDGSWQQQGIDLDGPTQQSFRNNENIAISLSGDGTHLAVGSPASNDSAPNVEGLVRVFNFHDSVTPTLSSSQTSIDGEKIIVTFNENLSADLPNSSQFSVSVNGTTRAITGIGAKGPSIELTLEQAIKSSDTNIQVSYSDASGGDDSAAAQDFSGNDVSSFSNQAVTNLSVIDLGSRFLVDENGNKFAEYGYAKVGPGFTQVDLNLSGGFSSPLVFSNVVSRNERDPVATRLNAVTSSSFQVQLDEPKYYGTSQGKSFHTDEIISYFVIEAGKHTLADKKVFYAKSEGQKRHPSNPSTKSQSWSSTISYADANFSDIPVLFGQSQTHAGADFITTRTKNVSKTGFQYSFQEAQNKGSHPAHETFAWLAYSGGKSSSGGIELEGQALDKVFTHTPKQQSFLNSYASTPFLLAGLRTFEGDDTAFSRVHELNTSTFTVGLQEESTNDGELAHTEESIHYLAIATSAPPSIQSATKSFAENTDTTSQVTVIDLQDSNTLTDQSPDGEAISYSIKSGNTDLFAINSNTGVITIKAGANLDYETVTSYALTIGAQAGNASTEAVITVNIDPFNDNDVVLSDNNSSQNTVAENASTGTTVGITALGTDADRGVTISSYALTDDAGGLFAINSSTGVVTVNGSIDYESKQSHTITVKATSSDSSATTKDFTIAVTNVDDNTLSVADSNSATNTITENATAGDGVGVTVLGTDADYGTSIAYDFTSNPSDLFAINASTGVITLAAGKTLDYESAQSHTVTVRATSTDSNGNTSTATKDITIAVTDVDDNTLSVADSNSAANTIAENATAGDGVGVTVLGTDADYGTSIAYDFTSNPSDLFAINASTGVITLAAGKTLDYESAQSHTVIVRATSTDSNGDTSTATKDITIAVTDVDDNTLSVADSNSATNTIAENAASDSTVGVTVLGTDADYGTSIAYDFTSNPSDLFAIDASTGVITLADGKTLDYESAQSHTVIVRATSTDSNGNTSTATKDITIAVTDVDDNTLSVADSNSATNTIAENAASDSTVGVTVLGTDADYGTSIAYDFTSNPSDLFAIDASTGVITLAAGKTLDYESAQSHTVKVRATSTDSNGNTSTATKDITIAVTDVDDNTLSLTDSNSATNTIAENATAGDGVGVTVLGTDADYGTSIAYDFTSNPSNLFAIDASTGVITLATGKTLDYESAQSHTVTVRATSTDSNGNTSTATKDITIAVTDVDDNTLSVADSNSAANTIAENATSDSTVGVTVLGTDADYGTSIAYDFTSNPSNLFAINASTGVITLAAGKTLDYESAQSHAVKVRATSTDSNGDTSTATKEIIIAVTDVNDIKPVIDDQIVTVKENFAAGTAFLNINDSSQDDDIDAENNDLSYTIQSGNTDNLFQIDADTGELSIASGQSLTYVEGSSNQYVLVVQASDGALTDTANITIKVGNVDTSAPDIEDAAKSIAESISSGTEVIDINDKRSGQDQDNDGDAITYTFTSDGNPGSLFAINASTGQITLADGQSLDYENANQQVIRLVVQASDGSKTDQATITINVTDVDDNTLSVADSNSATNTIAENATAGDGVGVTVVGTDADYGTSIAYDFTSNPSNLFAINASTGVITLADGKTLDYESAQSHTVKVRATSTDSNGNTSTATKDITINVTDVDDNTLSVADSNSAANTIAENAASDSTVGVTVLGTDADYGTSIAYDFTSNPSNLFAIDASTGVITLADGKTLDYESAQSHTVKVRATSTDSNGNTSTATKDITIAVTDVDDNTLSVADSNSAANTIAENAASDSTVGVTVLGTDADYGTSIAYDFTSNPSNLFAINASTGVITLATGKTLDYESAQSHAVTVRATSTDSNGNTSTATKDITIAVTDVDDNTLSVADSNSAANTIAENATAGDGVGVTVLGTDADYGTSIAYDFTSNPSDLFAINASTGVITLAAGKTLDYESAQSHTVIVRATSTDSNGNTSTATKDITIAVTDVDDNTLSVADSNSATNTIAENAASDSTVGVTVLGTDADYGTSIAYDFTSNPSNLFAINASTGVITLADGKTLDYESAQSHTVKVRATSTDSNGNTSTATKDITINVTDVDDSTLSVADSNSAANTIAENAASDSTVGVTVLGTDADYGTSIAYDFTSNPSDLFAIDASTGVITLAAGKTLDYESAQSHTVKVRATSTDSNGNTSTATKDITITVTDVDEFTPSLSDGDSTANTVAEDATAGTSVGVTAIGSDGDAGTSFSYAFASDGNPDVLFDLNASTGVVTLAGSLDYESATSHSIKVVGTATDSNGGSKTTEETFQINVGNINDNDPALAALSVDVLDSISAGTELADLRDSNTSNDTDRDGDAIEYSITAGNENKLFTINKTTGKLSLATGKSLDYDKSDQHVLTIKATDSGGRSGTATITIDVQDSNTAPVAADDAITLNEDSSVDVAAASGIIQSNDSDQEGDSLTVHKFYLGESTETLPTEGILGQAINGTYGLLTLNADGSYQYSADNANALGSGETAVDSFHYVLTDNKLTQTADIKFSITGINDAPSLVDATKKKKYTEGQGNVTVIDGSLDIVDPDDTEIASATIKFSSDTYQASEDVLGFTNVYSIIGNWDNTTGELSLTGTASLSNYIAALETVTYTNTDDADPVIGDRKIEWTVNDGESNSTAITSIVDVGGTNDAPESVDEAVAVEAGSTVSTESQAKLLANDTDPEGDSLTIQQFRLGTEQQSSAEFQAGNTLTGQFGKMTIESDGSYTYIADQTASKRLLTGETRTETFTYTVSDSKDTDTGEITFTITGINDSPVATNDAFEVQEDSSKFRPTVQGLISNDSDIDGDSLSISTVRTGAETSTFDISSNTLSRTAVGTYGTIVINEDGSYRYTADQDAADALDPGDEVTDLFTYTISDGETTDTAEIAIKVTGVNDQPTLAAIPAGTISDQENSTDLVTSNLTGTLTASDPDASASLSFGISAVGSSELRSQSNEIGLSATSTQAGTYGTLSLNTSTGAYNYTPNSAAIEALSAGDSVSDSFSLYASDGSLSATQSFQINITGATDPSSSTDSGSGSNGSSSSSSSTTSDQDDTALLSSKRQTNSFSTLTSDGQLQERYRSMPAAQKRDTGLGQDLNQFGLTSRNSDMELGKSNDGIGTALNIFGVTLLALLDPAEAIRAFLENLKGSGSKEVCEGADSWSGSEFCSQIDFEQQQAPALPLPTGVQGMAPQAQANPMANPAALGLEPLQPQTDPWWPDQTAQGF